jgi:hypothetical protein
MRGLLSNRKNTNSKSIERLFYGAFSSILRGLLGSDKFIRGEYKNYERPKNARINPLVTVAQNKLTQKIAT